MAVPLLHEENALGVLEVLDRPRDARFTLAEMELSGCSRTRPRLRSICSSGPGAPRVPCDGEGELGVLARWRKRSEAARR